MPTELGGSFYEDEHELRLQQNGKATLSQSSRDGSLPSMSALPPRSIEEMLHEQNLAPAYADCITRPLTPLQVDPQAIRPFVGSENAENSVKQYAFATFNSESQRAEKLAASSQAVVILKQRSEDAKCERQREAELQERRPRVEEDLDTNYERFLDPAVIAKLVKLVFWTGVFVISFAAEVKNATYLAMSSGLGFEEDWLGAFCFVLPTVLGALTVLKYLERSLTDRGRQKYIAAMNRVALPLAIATMVLSAWSLGAAHSEVDLFATEETAWTPPLPLLFGSSMMLLALMTAMSASLIHSSVVSLFQIVTRPMALFADSSEMLTSWDNKIASLSYLGSRMNAVVEQLASERQAFAMQCLAELRRQQTALSAKRAQLGADPLNS